jgi:pyruvate/2-oxoacid:ferredoxin oxidoreductase alpha subunit
LSSSIPEICDQLIEIKDQLEDSEELVEAILGNDNAEDLLVALGMAAAFTEDAITLNKKGEAHLKASLKELKALSENLDEDDEDDEDDE